MAHHPSALHNRGPILEVVKLAVLGRPVLSALEVGAGTGAHLEVLAPAMPNTVWQPSEYVPSELGDEETMYAKYGKIGAQKLGVLETLDNNLKGLPNVKPALALDLTNPEQYPHEKYDLIHAGNVVHIAPYPAATQGLFQVAHKCLRGAGGMLTLYGPFKRHGQFCSQGDVDFDQFLRDKSPEYGLRDVESQIVPMAARVGLKLVSAVHMPAGNWMLVFVGGV
ncbi:hypothetical protein BASA81_002328 [Batrachochytrium salamandrivorans]|nr:hypothetical protein BASA81_002328 [Batrachochytrium salamandrivorans]